MEEPSSMVELQIDESAQVYLQETSKWTRFLAITSYVFMGLMALGLVFVFMFKDPVSKTIAKSPELSRLGGMETNIILTFVSFIVIIALAVFMVITYYLLRFSTQTSKGIRQQDQVALDLGIGALKNYLIITGVLGILGLIFGLLQFLIML